MIAIFIIKVLSICKIGYKDTAEFNALFSEAKPENHMRMDKDYYTMQGFGMRLYVLKYLIMTAK